MLQKVYKNECKAVILESPGSGAQNTSWIFDIKHNHVIPSFDSNHEQELETLHTKPTNLKLILA